MYLNSRQQLAINLPAADSRRVTSRPNRVICLFLVAIGFAIILGIIGVVIALASKDNGVDGNQPVEFRLTPQQMANIEANYARLIADMGGVYRPELLREPEFYTRDLIGGFTAEQEQAILSSCGNLDIFRPQSDFDAIPPGEGQLDTSLIGEPSFEVFTRYVTQIVQMPLNRKKRRSFSRVCPGTSTSTSLVAISGGGSKTAQIVHINNRIQWVFNEECSNNGASCTTCNECRCEKVGRDVSAYVMVVGADVAQWKTVTIYSCTGTY